MRVDIEAKVLTVASAGLGAVAALLVGAPSAQAQPAVPVPPPPPPAVAAPMFPFLPPPPPPAEPVAAPAPEPVAAPAPEPIAAPPPAPVFPFLPPPPPPAEPIAAPPAEPIAAPRPRCPSRPPHPRPRCPIRPLLHLSLGRCLRCLRYRSPAMPPPLRCPHRRTASSTSRVRMRCLRDPPWTPPRATPRTPTSATSRIYGTPCRTRRSAAGSAADGPRAAWHGHALPPTGRRTERPDLTG